MKVKLQSLLHSSVVQSFILRQVNITNVAKRTFKLHIKQIIQINFLLKDNVVRKLQLTINSNYCQILANKFCLLPHTYH